MRLKASGETFVTLFMCSTHRNVFAAPIFTLSNGNTRPRETSGRACDNDFDILREDFKNIFQKAEFLKIMIQDHPPTPSGGHDDGV